MEEAKPEGGAGPTPMKRGMGLWIGIAIVVVVVVILLAAVLGGLFAAPAKAPLRIGTLLSLTGGLALFGPGDTKGANLAVEEINAAGGVLGQKVEVFNEDDQTNPPAAAAAGTKLITQNHVNAIVGAQFSGGSIALVKIAGDNGVVMVSPSATSVKLSNLTLTNGWFFRTISSDRLQGSVAASYLYTNSSFRWANAMVINNPYGTGLGGIFKTKFEGAGGTVNTTVTVAEAQADYTSAITTLFSTNPQVVYFVAYPDTGLTVMKQWQAGLATHPEWDRQWVFSEGLQDQGFIDQLRDPAVGVDVTKLWGTAPAAPNIPLYNAFVASYKARYTGQEPVLYASHSYDAVYLIALAAQKAGAVDGASIKAQLRTVSNPPGTTITGGHWAEALTALSGGGDVNWEGSSGTQDLNATNDPTLGSYEIWGVNSTFKITRKAFFGESLVQPVSPLSTPSYVPAAPNDFLAQVRLPAVSRWN